MDTEYLPRLGLTFLIVYILYVDGLGEVAAYPKHTFR